jgi:plastocyanin
VRPLHRFDLAGVDAGRSERRLVKTFQFKPTPLTMRPGPWCGRTRTRSPRADVGAPGQPTTAFAAVTLDGAGSSGSVTIAAPGTYPYFCGCTSPCGEIVVT